MKKIIIFIVILMNIFSFGQPIRASFIDGKNGDRKIFY